MVYIACTSIHDGTSSMYAWPLQLEKKNQLYILQLSYLFIFIYCIFIYLYKV
jgi:hypothetical protein